MGTPMLLLVASVSSFLLVGVDAEVVRSISTPPAVCPGGSLQSCVDSCPGAPLPAFDACVATCAKRCTATPSPPYVVKAACRPTACCPPDLPMGGGRNGNAQIRGPSQVDPASIRTWLAKMKSMRTACQQAIGYNGSAFEVPELRWTQTAYVSPQMHPYDRFFFDPSKGNGTNGSGYTVDRWLGDLNRRYGGIDKALIWPTYTNIGIDDRNTFDLIRSMPGGAEGIKVVVEQLHARGVKVLWPYHPWDHSTRGQQNNNVTDFVAMAELNRDTGADGFNADTMTHVPKGFYDAAVKLYKPIAMEAEGGITSTWDLNYVTLGWAEGWNAFEPGAVNNIPNVDKAKWISEGKAMHNWCDRWSGDRAIARLGGKTVNKTAELQVSFFNGLGYETWENVWGTWNGIHDRDGETIRRVATLLRYFGNRDFLTSTDWEPHTNDAMMMERGVFASAFPRGHEIVYFLVNMQPISVRGEQLRVETAHNGSIRWFDCYNGVEIEKGECPTTACRMPVWTTNSTGDFIHMDVPANGFACVVGTQNSTTLDDGIPGPSEDELRGQDPVPPPADLTSLLKTMATLTKRPLSTFSDEFHFLPQTMVDADLKTPLRPASSTTSPSETFVSGGHFHFIASGVELEGGPDSGVDVQYPWEEYPRRHHDHELQIGPMIVDTFPVTNKQYSEFLNESGYSPRDTANWLKQNFVDGLPRPGWESKPVTYVSLEDAKAYCAHYKKRLPNPMEWQYFAQGTDGRLYPWGNYDDYTKTPALSNNWTNPGPEPVGKYPAGASPFHIQDLVRSVWQYTSEFQDNHTRAVILRGGSNYGPYRGKECRWIDNDDGTPKEFGVTGPNGMPACFNRSIAGTMHEQHVNSNVRGSFDLASGRNLTHVNGGSHWYFPPAFKLNSYNKYYLMSGSYERAGTVGFRCIADAEAGPPTPPPAARRNSSATCSPHLPLCLLPLVDTYPIYPRNAVGNRPIMLSQPSAPGNRVLDWIHWSHVTSAMQQHRSTFVWAADRKKLGVQPSIWHPANSSSLVNYTTIIQYKWHGGVDADRQAEQDTAAPHTAGVATNGSVTMTIPNHEGRWQLTLFVGVLNATAKLTVSHAATGRTLTRLVDVSSQPADTAGDDNLEWNIAVNKKVVVVFQGSIKITWAMQSNGQEQPHSSVSWQAAVMEVPAS